MGAESKENSRNNTLVLATTMGMTILVALALIPLIGLLVSRWADPPIGLVSYQVIPLLDSDQPTCAVSINDMGQILLWETRHVDHVITYGEQPIEMKAWVRDPGGHLREIPGLGGKWVHPRDIDERGAVLGEAETSERKPHGFIWEGSGEPRDLGELGFDLPYAEIHCWDDSGRIGGMYYQPITRGGRKVFGRVPRIWNSDGEVASTLEEGNRVVELGQSGTILIDSDTSREGEIISATGERISLGELAHQGSRPLGMNDQGEVVGYSSVTNTIQGTIDGVKGAIRRRKASIQWEERPHAFLWRDGEMSDLNGLISSDSGWELLWAFAINNKGQIVGGGVHEKRVRAFLLEPVADISPGLQ